MPRLLILVLRITSSPRRYPSVNRPQITPKLRQRVMHLTRRVIDEFTAGCRSTSDLQVLYVNPGDAPIQGPDNEEDRTHRDSRRGTPAQALCTRPLPHWSTTALQWLLSTFGGYKRVHLTSEINILWNCKCIVTTDHLPS